jgi:hypothetical protein
MRAESHPIGVGDAHTGGHDVVDHPGKLVHAVHRDRAAAAQSRAHDLETLDRARPMVGPHHIGQHPEQAVGVKAVRGDQSMREQMQSQIGVVGVGGLIVERADHRAHDDGLGIALVVAAGQRRQLVGNLSHR